MQQSRISSHCKRRPRRCLVRGAERQLKFQVYEFFPSSYIADRGRIAAVRGGHFSKLLKVSGWLQLEPAGGAFAVKCQYAERCAHDDMLGPAILQREVFQGLLDTGLAKKFVLRSVQGGAPGLLVSGVRHAKQAFNGLCQAQANLW